MSRETISNGRQTIGAKPEKKNINKNLVGIGAAAAISGIGVALNSISNPKSTGERHAEEYLIDKAREQITAMKDKIALLNGFNNTINNQSHCVYLLSLIQNIVNSIGVTTSVNNIIFDIKHISNGKLYSWQVKVIPQTTDGIRRETDLLKVELVDAPEFNDNVVRAISASANIPITYVLAEAEWRYL